MPQPRPQDLAAGRRVRERRLLLGLSQQTLGAAVGLTFQQIQKYENGRNGMRVSRLCDIAAALDCHPADLLPARDGAAGPARIGRRDLALIRELRIVGPEVADGFRALARSAAAAAQAAGAATKRRDGPGSAGADDASAAGGGARQPAQPVSTARDDHTGYAKTTPPVLIR